MLRRYPVSAVLQQLIESEFMSYRQSPNLTMNGLKSHSSQRGIGQWWMILTIGIMVGFVFGFILFLSRLPNDNYTLVETERGIEQVEGTDAEQFAFYDKLSDSDSLVPNAEADDLPAFNRSNNAGKFGAAVNERPSAVKIADELTVGAEVAPVVAPVEIAAAGGAGVVGSAAVVSGVNGSVNSSRTSSGLNTRSTQTVVKRTTNSASTFYYLQAGAFAKADDANRLQRRLVRSGMDAFINNIAIQGKQWHRVRLGPFYDSQSLYSAQNRLGRNGISYLVVKVQKG